MNKLSQRTIVRMMEALSTVPGVECSRVCYEQDIPNWFVTHARSYYRFNWDHILPALRDTRFFFANYSSFGGNILGKEYFPEDEAQATGEWLLQKLAAMAACLPDGAPVENSLQLDGFAVDRNRVRLIPLEGPVSAQREEDAFTALLQGSGLPNAATVDQHVKDANDLFVQGKSHPSLNESRNMVQALIDDISTETDQNGNHTTKLPGGTGNRI